MLKQPKYFIPHKGNINSMDPNKTTLRLAKTPTLEAIAQQFEVINTNHALTEIHSMEFMQEWEEKIEGKFVQFAIDEHCGPFFCKIAKKIYNITSCTFIISWEILCLLMYLVKSL